MVQRIIYSDPLFNGSKTLYRKVFLNPAMKQAAFGQKNIDNLKSKISFTFSILFFQEKRLLLLAYFIFVLLMFVVLLLGGVFAYVFRQQVNNVKYFKNMIETLFAFSISKICWFIFFFFFSDCKQYEARNDGNDTRIWS